MTLMSERRPWVGVYPNSETGVDVVIKNCPTVKRERGMYKNCPTVKREQEQGRREQAFNTQQ